MLPTDLEGRQAERCRDPKAGVAQDLEGKMQALSHLALIVGRLCAQTEDLGAEIGKLAVMIAKRASLRRAAASARYRVPSIGHRMPRQARLRIAVDHGTPRTESAEIDIASGRGAQRHAGLLMPVRWAAAPPSTGRGKSAGSLANSAVMTQDFSDGQCPGSMNLPGWQGADWRAA